MGISEKRVNNVIGIVKKELKNEKRERVLIFSLWALTLISIGVLLIFLSTKLFITGYASSISSKGGTITEVEINLQKAATYWAGIYGLAFRISGFFDVMYHDAPGGSVLRKDVFFDCIKMDAEGLPEVYASTANSINFDQLRPATLQELDDFVQCHNKTECPSNTFTDTMSIMLGPVNLSGIPSTHTFKFDGDNQVFDIGAMNDSTNLVFVTHIVRMQGGYTSNVTVNYQMLLPVPENLTSRYYFFVDPFDTCPSGGTGETIDAQVSGYAKDNLGNLLSNVSIILGGYVGFTDIDGFYNISFSTIPGIYDIIARKTGYDPGIENITISLENYVVQKNFTLIPETISNGILIYTKVYGFVTDDSNTLISNATVFIGNNLTSSDSNGYYELYTKIAPEPHPLVSYKEGYNNYYAILNFTENTTEYNHNITLITINDNPPGYEFPTGPYPSGPYSSGPYSRPPGIQQKVIEETKKKGEDYWVSTKEIKREVRQNTFVEEVVGLYNFKTSGMNLVFSLSPELSDFIKIDKNSLSLNPDSYGSLILTIYGTRPVGTYNGTLSIKGDVEKAIPIIIKVVEKRFIVDTLLMDVDMFNRVVMPGDKLKYKLTLQNLLRDQGYKVLLDIAVSDSNGTKIYAKDKEEVELVNSLTLLKEITIPENATEGEYLLNVHATYLSFYSSVTSPFIVSYPIYLYSLFGIPLWLMFVIIAFFSFLFLNFFIYRTYKERKKRYRILIDFNSLPKKGERVIRLGNLAETTIPAYYELERLTTHAIIAGATGMGKSISAQVIIEEALLSNIAVIVFDPTAQWSGMLRKCEDKRMISLYPKFGLKESDVRGFKGNVRQIKDPRQRIDVTKYMNPGQIQIFSLNKLDPKDMDIFIANVIRQIFKSDPKESPVLKLLIVFDEVHRLLSKFGGSGQGFIQVERSCREFRKWGLGVMLISQVLSDFVGEIKANINTEVQTRTLEETDLERIKTKYGEEYLKSLVRAEVGVTMFQNAEYNRGRPYFINFRPILHNTRRLPDEELDKYNKYNDLVDEIEYQIGQLELEKIDTFDLKMELKLVKDKIMTGSFSVVEIYLEGLRPRVEKEWEKLGKKPKKRELELVSEEEIKKSIEEAKKERQKIEKEEEKKKAKEVASMPKVEVKENLDLKEVPALTFDNGIMVSSLKELKAILPTLDNDIFKGHVNEKKNDIALWFTNNFSKEFGEKINGIIDKKVLINEINNFGKEKPQEKKEEKNEEVKAEKKDEKVVKSDDKKA